MTCYYRSHHNRYNHLGGNGMQGRLLLRPLSYVHELVLCILPYVW